MTEIDKLKRAQFIIEKLANGIDPITEQLVPKDDTVNNVKISRCFFYVSDILNKLINEKENREFNTIEDVYFSPKLSKLHFSLTREQILRLKTSQKPISCSEIARYLNSIIDQSKMEKISENAISKWLINIGVLVIIQDSKGRNRKRPTQQGQDLGITLERREGQNGLYNVVVYNEEAQQFIYDNLDAIITFRYKGV